MQRGSPNLQREIKNITPTGNDPRIEFHNGSWIRTVAARDGARGHRSNLLIVDEYRMVPLSIISTVLRKFQSAPRKVGFVNQEWYMELPDDEQEALLDRNQEMYLSSAWYKADPSWERVKDYAELMARGEPYFVCQLPYQLAIKEGLYHRAQAQEQMNESSFNPTEWTMEMEAQFWGANMNGYFTYDELAKNRVISQAYYPKNIVDIFNDKKLQIPKKEANEIRVVSADIATMGGNDNDASVYTVARLIRDKNGNYDRQVVYMEDMEGGHTQAQAIRIRELFEDFDCDYIVLDTQSAGIGVYDAMTTELVNPMTGEVYQPVSCMNDERLEERCHFANAPKVVYSIRATPQLNSLIASNMKDALWKGRLKFPIPDQEAEDILSNINNYNSVDPVVQAELRRPYLQSSFFVNEVLNLSYEDRGDGIIRLKEPRSGRKDRYSSVSYLNYFASELEVKNRKPVKENKEAFKMFMARAPKLY